MNLSIAICPSTPLLVPELGGEAAAETGELRAASVTVARSLPAQWIAIGVGDGQYHADMSGTFAGYGADVRVSLSDRMGKPAQLPLPVLIAGWLRSRAEADEAEVRLVGPATDALAFGRALRGEIERRPVPPGVLIVADGANTLTDKAPGGYRPDAASLRHLPDAITGRPAYQVLAGLVDSDVVEARCLYRGSPYGVGYFAGIWRVS